MHKFAPAPSACSSEKATSHPHSFHAKLSKKLSRLNTPKSIQKKHHERAKEERPQCYMQGPVIKIQTNHPLEEVPVYSVVVVYAFSLLPRPENQARYLFVSSRS